MDLFGRFLWGMEEVTFLVPSKYWVCGLSSSTAQSCRLLWASPASLDAGCQEGIGLGRAGILPSKFSKAFATLGNKRYVLARTIGQFL